MHYLYRLGHEPNLGEAEFRFLKGREYVRDGNWLRSDLKCEIGKTGSLVFRAKILDSVEFYDKLTLPEINSKIEFALTAHLQEFPTKKAGFAVPKFLDKTFLKLAKSSGVKKVNLLASGSLPTIGNFEHTKKWFVVAVVAKDLQITEVEEYSPQEFWSVMDEKMPERDMRRGIINLKLARTLLNFTKSKKIYDPFCGLGRNLIAGIDLKKEFVMSDLEQVCIPQAEANFEWAKTYFATDKNFLNEPLANLKDSFAQNAANFNPELADVIKNFVIVSEGTLGKNFNTTPNDEQVEKELQKMVNLWQRVLQTNSEYGTSEIIVCLPFYPKFGNSGKINLDKILFGSKYKIAPLLPNLQTIEYSRSKSFVGHEVVKFVLK
jgi:hypothetical protein